jgi:type I restriction enzyme S subunit
MSLPRYSAYKASGVPWFSEAPAHWETSALKRIVSLMESGVSVNSTDEPAGADTAGVLKTSCVYAGRFDPSENKAVVQEDLHRVSCPVKAGTLIVSRMNTPALVGAAGLVEESVERLFLPDRLWQVHLTEASPAFVHYWTNSPSYRAQVQMACAGASSSMQNLSQDEFLGFFLPLPNVVEQEAIAGFLDCETSKIDALIVEQEKLIALLAEKRQATISHAVTRGLNPNAPMKDSGVAWLGHIPAHWSLTRLARIALDRCDGPFGSGIKSEHYTDDGALVIRLQNIRAGTFNRGEPAYIDTRYFLSDLKGHEVIAGDLLVAGLGDENNLLGRSCVAPDHLDLALVKADCFRFRLDTHHAVAAFVAWQLSAGASHDAGMLATGTTRSRIPLGTMASRKIALPPIAEQQSIVDFIAQENSKLDLLKLDVDRAISLLKERRSALIAAAVTGQIDVREAVVEAQIA